MSEPVEEISVHSKADSEVPVYEGLDYQAEQRIHELARKLSNKSYDAQFRGDDEEEVVGIDRTGTSASNLVKTLTTMSQVPGVPPYSVDDDIDPRLNPNDDNFDAKFWVKNIRKLQDSDIDYYKPASLGVAYKALRAQGIAADADFQPTVLNFPYKLARDFYYEHFKGNDQSRYFDILKPMDGLIKPGTLTVVLGRPGAGCSTFLKTIASQCFGFKIDKDSLISYDGLTPDDIKKHFRGEIAFSAELDSHFPNLTVGQTLEFASLLRVPQNRPPGISREDYASHMADVYMATYGLLHTRNTKVGNDFIRGVSGGERKRVSIAEVSLCGSKIQCWDNATRGLDAATALEFIRALKTSAVILDTTPLIAIYQCSQDAYDLFDTTILLYEGYQIYQGPATKAKAYFERMGYECPARQTTADFLTSITFADERKAKDGWEDKVPKTPKEFYDYWMASPEHKEMIDDIDNHLETIKSENHPQRFHDSHVATQANHTRATSSFTLSYWMQVKVCYRRAIWKIKGDPSINLMTIIANTIMGLILSSLFYNLQPTTGDFYYRTACMFFAVLFNAFSSLLEIFTLFENRRIVEKHKTFSLYHPSADAFGNILSEIPTKVITAVCFNLIFYFMVHFRRDAGRFFFYFLINVVAVFVMSHIFRSLGSCFRSLPQAMSPAALLLLILIVYAGFVLPTPSMLGWSRWINYLNPIAYVFEALITNEFQDVQFECSAYVPAYDNASLENKVCSVTSSEAGKTYVDGTRYVNEAFDYYNEHKWRNFGIALAFAIVFLFVYVTIVELSNAAVQKGEILVFQQSTLRKLKKQKKLVTLKSNDIEAGYNGEKPAGISEDVSTSSADVKGEEGKKDVTVLAAGKDIFHWKDVCYEVKIKDETRKILNGVDGWVKPGTLTALMGASGAGKTTLLDVLANRVTMGVVTGSMFVNGRLRDQSFQRSTGYVQQQDLHLQTSTVREALRFSAYLRQPYDVSKTEKDEYVENVISILDMEAYADAIVGVSGEGLNVEQRKRLTIGVELAAKPQLLLFLDEPTSGLDSQTAWSICQLMRKLADNGQAVLCTIHQPSAILLQEFDRLLFLARGGRTVYFGDLGPHCRTLIDYFERNGAHKCPPSANPAEWMLEVIGAAPGSHASQDYHEVWLNSAERQAVRDELDQMERELVKVSKSVEKSAHAEFATPLVFQYVLVSKRVFEQYFRTPSYIWYKILLSVVSALFNGFTFFKASTSLQGLQNQMLSMFMFTTVLLTLIQQMLPSYVSQRALYEVRERPSKTFSWIAFILAQITAEIPWSILVGTLGFFCWYYPLGVYTNAALTHTTAERGAYSWLMIVAFYIYAQTLGFLCAAGIEVADNAANAASLLFTMSLNFCGVLYYPTGFWSFMYRVSPFTYWIGGMIAACVGNAKVHCAEKEFVRFPPPSGQTCSEYMSDYISLAGGYLQDENATSECSFCSTSETNTYLTSLHISMSDMWRNYGIFLCYIVFNIAGTIFLYWLARVPKSSSRVKGEKASEEEKEQNQLERTESRRSRSSKSSKK